MKNGDQILVEQCLANNRLAQKRLYDKYKRAMYTLCYRISNDFDLAHDMLQDGFIEVFKSLSKFRFESTLGAWIKTIIVRAAYKRIKKRVYFEDIENLPDNTLIDWGTHLDVEYLEKAIHALPDGYRTVFTLIEIEGYTHREVAEMLSISEGTSKSQLFYAKKKLRSYLSLLEESPSK